MKEKRFPINFRAFLITAVTVTSAVFCVFLYMINVALGLTLGIVLLCGFCVLFVLFVVKCKRGKAKLRVAIGFGLAFALAVCAFIIGIASVIDWRDCGRFAGHYGVSGRVCAVEISENECRIELDGLTIGGERAPGKMCITSDTARGNIAELVSFGDALTFSADVRVYKLYSGGYIRGSNYRTDIRYYADVALENISVNFGDPRPLEAFLSAVHGLLVDNMGDRYGNIAYSMLTGDKHALFPGVSEPYSAVGLGHILAVSGLHIGFVILLLSILLARADKRISVPIMLLFIVGYVVIADFSPSVVRAAIMATVSGATIFFGGRKDMLSSLLCAYSGILAVKPIYLFDVGFLLSFGALGGIALFANSIRRALSKKHVHEKIGSAVGASVSVSIGIAPAQIYYFGKVPILAIIVNIVLMPFLTVMFVTTLVLLPVAAIPGCGAVLTVSKWMFAALDYLVYGLSLAPFANIPLRASAGIFACYPIMFCASEYFMVRRGKKIIAMYSAVICLIILLICTL